MGAQFNLCVIDSGKRKEPGPSPVCPVLFLNLPFRLANQKVLYSTVKSFLERTYLKVTLWHHCNILPGKKDLYPIVKLSNPSLALISSKQALGLFSPTAAFTEIVYTFLCSKCHFHFYFPVEEGSCPLLFHVQPALDILQLHILPNTKLLKQSAFGVV